MQDPDQFGRDFGEEHECELTWRFDVTPRDASRT